MSTSADVARFTGRELRDHLGLFPTGVAVVTATFEGGVQIGTTVSSFNSVSLDPPLVSFNLASGAKSFEAWRGVSEFAVSILGEEQSELSTRFARAMSDKWAGLEPERGAVIDAPLLPGALAHFECSMFAQHSAGDHVIILGKVEAIRRDPRTYAKPLLFFSSRYRHLADELAPAVPYNEALWIHGW